ncbi:MAG: asparagine synthase (glutamine-hydrolyzing) [Saprospiraceae bacterium]
MCGIAGVISEKNNLDKSIIQNMTDALAHRGPDAGAIYQDGKAALGHRRLSIIDLSELSNQPMLSHDGRYIIVFNGELYNFKEVKKEINNYPFKSSGDSEVILAAYIKWGVDCLRRFNGMFAFAIWDKIEESLFVVRDRLGIKPLYFSYKAESHFIFASEIRSILKSGLTSRQIDRCGLSDYINYQTVHAPKTIIKDIFQLMPGEYGIYKKGKLTTKKYWDIIPDKYNPNGQYQSYEKVKNNVRQLLSSAVEKRLVSDVPIGAFLSGGIDSSAVVALMSEISERPVDTFSIIFKEKQFDESEYSDLIAKKYKTNHHPILLNPSDFMEEMPNALAAMDVPSGDGVNTYVVSKATKNAGVVVTLSGLGGDELFAGYPFFEKFAQLQKMSAFWKIPAIIRKGFSSGAGPFLKSHQRAKIDMLARANSAEIDQIFPTFRRVFSPEESNQLLNTGKTTCPTDSVEELLLMQKELKKLPLLSQVSVSDISTYTQNILLRDTDQMSMAHALEVRVPFFDHELVEYVIGIPDNMKKPEYAKKLLVESLKPLVPNEIVFRQKKGFHLPWKIWMKKELKSFCDTRINSLAERGMINGVFLKQLWGKFLSGKNDNLWSRIWIFVVLEDWMQRNGIEE